jgi:multisubunit Na+/H+ antiporter MnhE subunit
LVYFPLDVNHMHLTKTVCYDLGNNEKKILNIPYTNYSNMYRTKVLDAALTPGSSVIKHLKQDQYLEVHRSKRKQLKESKQIRSMTRQRKYEMQDCLL